MSLNVNIILKKDENKIILTLLFEMLGGKKAMVFLFRTNSFKVTYINYMVYSSHTMSALSTY